MTFPIRGVVEGYYGPPRSWVARERSVDFMADRGLNAYLYAPKNEPLHRARWREPYLPEEQARFAAFDARCRDGGVDFVFGLSPLGFCYDTDDDLACLLAKFDAVDAAGIRFFCLLTDDMSGRQAGERVTSRFDDLAQAHAWLVSSLHRHLRRRGHDRSLWFVPVEYCGSPTTPYLGTLGELVPSDVPICWTGPQVCSPTISLEHTREVAAVLRRPVLYWDNHPVNDGDMRFDPHLGPLTGRDPRLPEAACGLLANLALESEASHVAVATVADYCADPSGYKPQRSWRRALVDVAGDPADAAAVAVLAELAWRSPLGGRREDDHRLTGVLARLRQAAGGGDADRRAALADARAEAVRLAEAVQRLVGLGNPWLRDDLRPWVTKLASWTAALTSAVDVLARALDDPNAPGLTASRRAATQHLAQARTSSYWVSNDLLDRLTRACLWQAAKLGA
ncbi:MAG: protein O-GlcNAcase [Actinomycetota bacterium]|nr:protein O-GlcNAcase [Actinomycetota bacterium]